MKKLNSLLVIVLLTMPMLVSCSNDDSEQEAQTAVPATVVQNAMPVRIADCLAEIMANKDGDYDDGGYIVYSAGEDDMVVCSDIGYGLGSVFSDWMSGNVSDSTAILHSSMNKAPKGKGWIYGGSCKTKLGALSLGTKIAQRIPSNCDFEIHAEKQANGSYLVWYRVIENAE